MARHNAKHGNLRAISQDTNAGIQMLNKELRNLKDATNRQGLNKSGSKHSEDNSHKPKS